MSIHKNSELKNIKNSEASYYACMAIAEAEATLVGERVRWFREYVGMSGSEFARELDVLPSQLSDWEKGRSRLSIQGALKIYARFDITPDFFFLGKTAQLPQNLAQAWHSSHREQSA